MSTDMMWQTESISSEATEQLAERVGANLRGGEVIELTSDLGGGKTTFTRGLVRGAGSHDHVSSPTFTISNLYKTPQHTIYHFDFYRLPEAGLIGHELHDAMQDENSIIIVEWGGVVQDVLPKDHISVKIERTPEDSRIITFNYPESYAYVLKGLKEA